MDKTVATPTGQIAYTEVGEGPAALFVHGVFLNSRLWRDVIAGVADVRRCIAVDLPGHGRTGPLDGCDYSLTALARVLEEVCDALGLDQVDLVANDTGGAVAQVFAATHPERLRSFTLTNCDCHDNLPPADFKQVVDLAKIGELAPVVMQLAADPELARSPIGLGSGYERAESLSDEKVDDFLGPFRSSAAATALQACVAALDAAELLAVEPALEKLDVPTLVAWGTGDQFFDVSWAWWLRDTIPGVKEVVTFDGAKLFFPDERAAELIPVLRRFWEAHSAVPS
jgi:pimeloyl-ACP methyl ester carboxylesterase